MVRMTTPNDPHDDRPQHPENQPGNQAGDHSHPSYPSYPSTPHPEDGPGYGRDYGADYGAAQDHPGYQDYAGYQAYGVPGQYGQPGQQAQGDGRVRPMDAVGWAFRTVFRNWPIWIIGSLVLGVAVSVASLLIDAAFGGLSGDLSYQSGLGYQLSQVALMLAAAAVGIFVYHGALRQVDKEKIRLGDFTSNVNFGPAFGVSLVLQIVSGIAMTAFVAPLLLGGNDIANSQMATQDEALAFMAQVFAGLGVFLLVALLLAPLTMFMVWFAVDRRTGFTGAFGAGIRAGLRNYGALLLFSFVAGLVMVIISVVTFGLAVIVLAPAFVLTQALLYRQAAPGPLPVETHRR